jgi:hypothetical protein
MTGSANGDIVPRVRTDFCGAKCISVVEILADHYLADSCSTRVEMNWRSLVDMLVN